jgi:hypothetical protein
MVKYKYTQDVHWFLQLKMFQLFIVLHTVVCALLIADVQAMAVLGCEGSSNVKEGYQKWGLDINIRPEYMVVGESRPDSIK